MYPSFLGIGADACRDDSVAPLADDSTPTFGYPLPKSSTTSIGCRADRASRIGSPRVSGSLLFGVNGSVASSALRLRGVTSLGFAARCRTSSSPRATADISPCSRAPAIVQPARSPLPIRFCPTSRSSGPPRCFPDVRVIIMLRDPIGRAWSQVQLETNRPVSMETAKAHVASADSLERGNYPAIVDRWMDHFPKERIFVGFVDEARTRPLELVRAVLAFLGVDPDRLVSSLPDPLNSSGVTTIPTDLALDLAVRYRPVLEEMASRFDGPAEQWRAAAERLLEAPPQVEELPLPLADDLNPASTHLSSGALAAG